MLTRKCFAQNRTIAADPPGQPSNEEVPLA
jgi:hypothetical protein